VLGSKQNQNKISGIVLHLTEAFRAFKYIFSCSNSDRWFPGSLYYSM